MSMLANGTEVGPALTEDDPTNRRAAHRAGLPMAVVYTMPDDEQPRLTVRPAIIGNRAAAMTDTGGEYRPDRLPESFELIAPQRRGPTGWPDSRPEQRLIGIDVSDSRHLVLIQER